jgi:hypothetical protein
VTRRRHIDQASARPNERSNAVDQDKVAQVIRYRTAFRSPSAVWPNGVAITPALAMTTSNGSPFASNRSAQARTLFRLAGSSSTSSKLPPLAAASFRTCSVRALALSNPAPCLQPERRARPESAPFPRRFRPKYLLRGSVCPSDSRQTKRHLWSKLPHRKLPQVCRNALEEK